MNTCSTCNRPRVVLLTHTTRYRGRSFTWTECRECWKRAENDAERRAEEAIGQAEKAGA